ncbi:hypothetical protein GCM10010228_80160 [Streptomyces massasporeus]|nr:hypothetical protein GCM10010228_80160 [Streptomyces massasporeus]
MAAWLGWKKMPTGSTQCAPAVSGSANVFARGDDRVVYHSGLLNGQINGSWSPWRGLYGLGTYTGPAATAHRGSTYVFAVNDAHRLSYTRWNGSGADGWHEIPGSETANAPTVASGVIVLRRWDNNTLRYNTFDGDGSVLSWGNWRTVDGITTSCAPSITEFGAGYVLVGIAETGKPWYRDLGSDRTSWGAWKPVGGGQTYDAPAMAKSLLVVRGTDNALHWNSCDGLFNWAGWKSAQGQTANAPALAHSGSFFTLVVRGSDSGIYYAFYD